MASKNWNEMPVDVSARAIGARIYHARLEAGLSARELASRVKKNPSYISRIESGRVVPSLGLLKGIADALQVSLLDLLTDETASAELQDMVPDMQEIVPMFKDAKFVNLLNPGLKREIIEVYRKVKEVLEESKGNPKGTSTANV